MIGFPGRSPGYVLPEGQPSWGVDPGIRTFRAVPCPRGSLGFAIWPRGSSRIVLRPCRNTVCCSSVLLETSSSKYNRENYNRNFHPASPTSTLKNVPPRHRSLPSAISTSSNSFIFLILNTAIINISSKLSRLLSNDFKDQFLQIKD
jgi:hypothetical protein